VDAPVSLIIWHPFKLILFELMLLRTEVTNNFGDKFPNCR